METILNFHQWIIDKGDVRVRDWPFMGSPIPLLVVWVTYLVCVFLGPKLMANRKPFDLRPLMLLYNALSVALALYMAWEFSVSAWEGSYSLYCEPVDYSRSPLAMRMASVCWWFFFSKILELVDTMFFILRKKNNQLSFLHVYHHATMMWNWWLGANFIPGGHSFFNSLLNSGVHVIMYSYYFLSLLGPSVQPYLFWKRYLTQLQLAQFIIIIIHTGSLLFIAIPNGCDFHFGLPTYMFCYLFTLVILFSNFYVQAYRRGASKRTEAVANGSANSHVVKNGVANGVANGHAMENGKKSD